MEEPTADEARVAVVTGATRGLGAGLASAFAARGLRLGLCARTRPEVPPEATAVTKRADVTDPGAVDDLARATVDAFGRIDLWINNAGLLDPIGPLADADAKAIDRQLSVNLLGVVHGSATFARHVRSRSGGGVLVNISSGAAMTPYRGWAAYCAAKAATDMLTAVVAEEEADAGLRAYAVAPGLVDTDMQRLIRAAPSDRLPKGDRFRRAQKTGSFNTPDWVARHLIDLLDRPGQVRGWGPLGGEGAGVHLRVPDQPR